MTLLKIVAHVISKFWMSTLLIPMEVCAKIEKKILMFSGGGVMNRVKGLNGCIMKHFVQ